MGDVVAVTCPSDLSYGKSGAGSVIPPDAELNFEIELLEIGEKKYEELWVSYIILHHIISFGSAILYNLFFCL